jgi:hypothetical protein
VTTREPLYTEQDRAELLALAEYRRTLCPLCGGPMDECTAPEKTGPRYRAKRMRCQRVDALGIAQEAVRESKVPHPEALIWWTEKTGR